MISDGLCWRSQVAYVTYKANTVRGLRNNFNECSQELREISYSSKERSILEYASALMNPYLIKDTLNIDQIQGTAARFFKMTTGCTSKKSNSIIVSQK